MFQVPDIIIRVIGFVFPIPVININQPFFGSVMFNICWASHYIFGPYLANYRSFTAYDTVFTINGRLNFQKF